MAKADVSDSAADTSYVVSAGVLSLAERADKKAKYVYEIETKWSDDTTRRCYRAYHDFFNFHCKLLDRYPEEAGVTKSSTRTLPYLPGKQMFRRNTKSLAQERLPKLNQYVQDLAALPENISRSKDVYRFFGDNASKEGINEPLTSSAEVNVELLENGSNKVTYSPKRRSTSQQETKDSNEGTHVHASQQETKDSNEGTHVHASQQETKDSNEDGSTDETENTDKYDETVTDKCSSGTDEEQEHDSSNEAAESNGGLPDHQDGNLHTDDNNTTEVDDTDTPHDADNEHIIVESTSHEKNGTRENVCINTSNEDNTSGDENITNID